MKFIIILLILIIIYYLISKTDIQKQEFFNNKVNKIIYCFWTGSNPITKNRLEGIETLKKFTEVNIHLIIIINLN